MPPLRLLICTSLQLINRLLAASSQRETETSFRKDIGFDQAIEDWQKYSLFTHSWFQLPTGFSQCFIPIIPH